MREEEDTEVLAAGPSEVRSGVDGEAPAPLIAPPAMSAEPVDGSARAAVRPADENASLQEAVTVSIVATGGLKDSVVRFFGSGRYLLWQTALVVIWVVLNLVAVRLSWDPYPFILLNLVFSIQAAYIGPLILLVQNRQENQYKSALEDHFRRADNADAHIEMLAREMSTLRLAIADVATREDLRREREEIRDLMSRSLFAQPDKTNPPRI